MTLWTVERIMPCFPETLPLPQREAHEPPLWSTRHHLLQSMSCFLWSNHRDPLLGGPCTWISRGGGWGALRHLHCLPRRHPWSVREVLGWLGFPVPVPIRQRLPGQDVSPTLLFINPDNSYLNVSQYFQHDLGMSANSFNPLFCFRISNPIFYD